MTGQPNRWFVSVTYWDEDINKECGQDWFHEGHISELLADIDMLYGNSIQSVKIRQRSELVKEGEQTC